MLSFHPLTALTQQLAFVHPVAGTTGVLATIPELVQYLDGRSRQAHRLFLVADPVVGQNLRRDGLIASNREQR